MQQHMKYEAREGQVVGKSELAREVCQSIWVAP